MTYLNKFLSTIFVLITMFSFVLSTTGFTSHTHHCQNHKSQKSIVSNETGCCTELESADNSDEESCCKPSSCKTDEDHSTCCSEEINYYRLSEWFTATDSQKKQIIPDKNILLSSLVISLTEDELVNIIHESYHDPGPIIKTPKYRLHSQTKIDPPLI